ncbi:MAG: response regulator transcription factor [Burkholderiaceae bacterium]
MTAVVVVEPHALLRFGILQHLNEVLPESTVHGVDYSSLYGQAFGGGEIDLVLLSVALHEDVVKLVQAAQHVYAPRCILLLSDVATMPGSWKELPPIVAGYVPRSASPDVLAASIRLVLVGGKCFQLSQNEPEPAAPNLRLASSNSREINPSPPAANCKAEPLLGLVSDANSAPSRANAEARLLRITPRQYEVLVLLARGYPMKTVSRHLNISVATAKAHTETLYQRLDAHNRNQAIYTAVSRGATLGWQRLIPYNIDQSQHRG